MRHNQNRRSRGRNNNNNNNRKGPNPLTRSYESNGPDVKVRGTAIHVAEKYMSLARDAQSSGDIVAAENYLQHAEHYNRIVMAAQAQLQQAQQVQFRDGGEENADDDRQMNGRGPRGRFESNGDGGRDEEEGDDRFDSSEEEQERSFQPQPQHQPQQQYSQGQPRQQQSRPDDRDRPRGPRPDRPDRRDRPGDRGNRPERPERFDRPDRFDDREAQAQAPRMQPDAAPQVQHAPAPPPVQMPDPTPAPLSSAGDGEPAPARRRRGRPARTEGGPESNEAAAAPDGVTPDGAAALVAFPD